MAEEEVIKWQAGQNWYISLNRVLWEGVGYRSIGFNKMAFKGWKDVFLAIASKIEEKSPETYKEMYMIYKYLVLVFREYETELNKSDVYTVVGRQRMISITRLSDKIDDRLDRFYMLLYRMMWSLNMIVPVEKRDNKSGMDKYIDKYIKNGGG